MTPKDRKAFVEVVLGFAELKGKQLSAPALELYWRSLQHWELEDFKQAAEHLLRSCEFMPLPKDFEDLRKAGRPRAGEAWARVLSLARGRGLPTLGEQPTKLTDLERRALNAIGGLNTVAMSDVDKTPFLERRFCEHFDSIQDAMDVREAVPEIAYSGERRLSGPQSAKNLLGKLGGGKA
jgi:hypothetical protein